MYLETETEGLQASLINLICGTEPRPGLEESIWHSADFDSELLAPQPP